MCYIFFFLQAEDGIRDLVRSRGLGDVYKRQAKGRPAHRAADDRRPEAACDLEAEADRIIEPPIDLSLIHI